jgi:hypothetical protein
MTLLAILIVVGAAALLTLFMLGACRAAGEADDAAGRVAGAVLSHATLNNLEGQQDHA